ncbi:MAG: hypothetical protein CM15mV29_1040 [uncultured marine virus]|nr:MAG: hypothetical protein CM15mV29_1040 [uncultured marine virus]
MTQEQLEAVWVEMGTKMGYVDLHNSEPKQYQMATIFSDPKYSSFANCSTLKKDGCCVGEVFLSTLTTGRQCQSVSSKEGGVKNENQKNGLD